MSDSLRVFLILLTVAWIILMSGMGIYTLRKTSSDWFEWYTVGLVLSAVGAFGFLIYIVWRLE